MKSIFFLFALTLLSACSSTHIKPQESKIVIPQSEFKLYSNHKRVPEKWWHTFQSQELNSLVERCLMNNLDIDQAVARLKKSSALAEQLGSNQSVKVNGVGELKRTRVKGPTTSSNYTLGLAASYELDLWGSIASRVKAAELNEKVAEELLYALQISLTSELTSTWLQYISVKERIKLLDQQLITNTNTYQLMLKRFSSSQATALDIFQQKQKVAASKSILINEHAKLPELNNKIQILLGESPFLQVGITDTKLPRFQLLPSVGIPADLLATRPDLRAKGLALQSSNWLVAAAKADRLPQISLTATANYNGSHSNQIFNNWFSSLAGSLFLPIIDGGYRVAEVKKMQADVDEKLAAYKQAVLVAMGEVNSILKVNQFQEEFTFSTEQQCQLAQKTHQESISRYRNGLETYLPVLAALNSKQDLELRLISAKLQNLTTRVNLYRALGGNWPNINKDSNNE